MATQQAKTGWTTSPHDTTIVVGVDFTDASDHALRYAVAMACKNPGAQLHLVHVLDRAERPESKLPGAGAAKEVDDATLVREATERLNRYVHKNRKALDPLRGHPLGIHVRVGEVAAAVVEFAKEMGADLVVVGSHGRHGLKQMILGSNADKIVEASDRPVVVATPRGLAAEAQIEPPCPECVRARSSGASYWCSRHSEHHVRAHSYSYQREIPFAIPDADVQPTGTQLPRS